MPRVRLSEVAARAGVSPGAASLALNGRPGVSVKTRELVRSLAQEMGYAPHQGAKALSQGRTGLWGALVEENPDAWPPWLSGVLTQANTAGARLTIQSMPSKDDRTGHFRRLAAEGRLDGLLLLDPSGDDASLRPLWDSGIPTVVAGRRSNWFDCVEIHDRLAQEQILTRLSLDRKRPVALVATRSQISREDPRIGLWTEHVENDPRSGLVSVADDSAQSGATALHQILRTEAEIRAVLCLAGDKTAWGILREARLRKISVPGDLAVAGWGDLPFASWVDPELTTLRIPWEELGTRSAKLLQERLSKASGTRIHRTLDARAVMRRSA
jgi:LacI family transcriptional regulator